MENRKRFVAYFLKLYLSCSYRRPDSPVVRSGFKFNNLWHRAKQTAPSGASDQMQNKSGNNKGKEIEIKFCEDSAGLFLRDGMSTATARFIIKRDVGEKIGEVFDVKDLKNTGRYYIAKIVRPDGSVIEQFLIDKQNCKVHFPRGRYN